MKRLVQIVEQIHEAGRLLSLESAPHARMALLLLDNAIEILMHRAVMERFQHDDFYSRLFEQAKASLPADTAAAFIEKSSYKLIPRKERKAMRSFNPKVDFLTREGKLPEIMGQVVKALHRYRNDAHHQDKVRQATLQAAAVVCYELACEVLIALPPSSVGFLSTDDGSEFYSKYGVEPAEMIGNMPKIASKLRSTIGIDENSLAEILSQHLLSRLDELNEQLNFICEYSGATHSGELKRIQFCKEAHGVGQLSKNEIDQRFEVYSAKYTLDHIADWRNKAELLRTQVGAGKLKLLGMFCEVEQELEPLEEAVNEVASFIDQEIAREIDQRRGK